MSPRHIGSTGAAISAATASLGGALTAAFSALCCLGPATVALLGAGGAVTAAGLKPYRPAILAVSLALLGLGFWLSYRRSAFAGASCPTRLGKFTRAVLWFSAAVWVAAALLPQ